MAHRSRALLAGTPLMAGAVVFGAATAAQAAPRPNASPLERKSATFTFTKSDHTQVSCKDTAGIQSRSDGDPR